MFIIRKTILYLQLCMVCNSCTYMYVCKQSVRLKDVLDIRLHVQYILRDEDEMFETCRRLEELF